MPANQNGDPSAATPTLYVVPRQSYDANRGSRQDIVAAFSNRRREERERALLAHAEADLAELDEIVAELAALRGSPDRAQLGPITVPGLDDLEAVVHIRRRRP